MTVPEFPPTLIALVKRIDATSDPDARLPLMVELAAAMAREHDHTDNDLSDEVHELFTDYENSKRYYQQATLRLARFALDVLHVAITQAPPGKEEPPPKAN